MSGDDDRSDGATSVPVDMILLRDVVNIKRAFFRVMDRGTVPLVTPRHVIFDEPRVLQNDAFELAHSIRDSTR
jgi:hypothetical protein